MEDLMCKLRGPVLERVVPGEFDDVIDRATQTGDCQVWKAFIQGRRENPKGDLVCRTMLEYLLALLRDTAIKRQGIEKAEERLSQLKDADQKKKEQDAIDTQTKVVDDNLVKIDTLFYLAEQMQMTDEDHNGNFYKTWKDACTQFSVDQILHWQKFLSSLTPSGKRRGDQSPSTRIWGLLPKKIQDLIKENEKDGADHKQRKKIVNALNLDVLACREFYQKAYFANTALPADLKKEVESADWKNLPMSQVQRLNRRLINAAYADNENGENRIVGLPNYEPFLVVEFCTRSIVLIWHTLREDYSNFMLSDPFKSYKDQLEKMMNCSVQILVNNNTPPLYTNMYLMNCFNLMQVGEILGLIEVKSLGNEHFEQFMIYTWEWGVHEYCSPVYSGVQLNTVMLIERFCKDKQPEAKALLTFYWVYVGINWIQKLERLAGAESRQISGYLENMGTLTLPMQVMGFTESKAYRLPAIFATMSRWRPTQYLIKRAAERGLVRHTWGPLTNQSRTLCALDDVTLSVSGGTFDITQASVGSYPTTEDVLLAADFRDYLEGTNFGGVGPDNLGPGNLPQWLTSKYPGRMYFKPSHEKATEANPAPAYGGDRHLSPSHWAAAQSFTDALSLAFYVPQGNNDISSIYSYFVFPTMDTQITVDGVPMKPDETMSVGQSLVLFYKNKSADDSYAALGFKILWAADLAGHNISKGISYCFDSDNKVVRVTIDHSVAQTKEMGTAGFLVWTRIGSNLTLKQCKSWRKGFEASEPVKPIDIKFDVREKDNQTFHNIERFGVEVMDIAGGPMTIDTVMALDPPNVQMSEEQDGWPNRIAYESEVVPPLSQAVLEWDGSDVGRACLRNAPLIERYEASFEGVEKIKLPEPPHDLTMSPTEVMKMMELGVPSPYKTVHWNAENGQIWLPMVAGWEQDSEQTSDGKWYVWMRPNSISTWQDGSDVGNVAWQLEVPESGGTYYLWANVKTFQPKQSDPSPPVDGAFMVRIFCGRRRLSFLYQEHWHVGHHQDWRKVPVILGEGQAKHQFVETVGGSGRVRRVYPGSTPATPDDQKDGIPTPLQLPPGDITIQLFSMSWGTMLDGLYATTDPTAHPVGVFR